MHPVPGDKFFAGVVGTGRSLSVPDASAHPVYRDNPHVRGGQIERLWTAAATCDRPLSGMSGRSGWWRQQEAGAEVDWLRRASCHT